MHNTIYTKDNIQEKINELEIISYNSKTINVRKNKIPQELMDFILLNTINCLGNISERLYWILNNISDYPSCKTCNKNLTLDFMD